MIIIEESFIVVHYTITFKKETPIWSLYKRLIKAGVRDSDLDNGYYENAYSHEKKPVVGARDYKIDQQEVLDYALDRYEKYQSIIKETTGYVVPWSLDDLDSATTFDVEIRGKVTKVITAFKQIIRSMGYAEGTDDYQERLAVSLFSFAMFSGSKFPERFETELKSLGLTDVIRYLKENGGLEFMETTKDCELESTAPYALKNGCGTCTEESYILFALLKQAGLRVSFIVAETTYAGRKILNAGLEGHASVVIKLNKKKRYFDPALKSSDAERAYYKKYFAWWSEVGSREFLAVYYMNFGTNYKDKLGKKDLAIEAYQKALSIDPMSAETHRNLGVVYADQGKLDQAIAEYKIALSIRPDFVDAKLSLGNAYIKQRELELAIEELQEAIAINPDNDSPHNNLAVAYGLMAERLEKEKNVAKAIELYREAIKEFRNAAKFGRKVPVEIIRDLERKIKRLGG